MNIEESSLYKSIMTKYMSNKDKISSGLKKLKLILATESEQTSKMLDIYKKYISGEEITKSEMEIANTQFADIIKNAGLLGVFALPGGLVAIAFLVKIGKKLGIDILPKSYKD